MNSKKRVLTAIQHKKPDRTPRGDLAIEENLIRKLIGKERFVSLDVNERLLAAIQELGGDLVNVHQFPMVQVGETATGPIFRSIFGDEHIITKSSSRLYKPAFTNVREAAAYQAPAPSTCLTNNLEWFVKNSPLFIFAQISGPVSALDWMLGTENSMIFALTETECMRGVIEKVMAYEIARSRAFIDKGADAILIADDIAFNTGTFLPPHVMDEIAWPFYRQVIADIKNYKDIPVFMHSDGDIRSALPNIVDCGFDGLQSLQPSANVDIEEVKREYGSQLCLMGNMDLDRLMPFGTPGEVGKQANWLCENIGRDGGFILSTCNILTDAIPVENARAMYNVKK